MFLLLVREAKSMLVYNIHEKSLGPRLEKLHMNQKQTSGGEVIRFYWSAWKTINPQNIYVYEDALRSLNKAK